jgi:DtxR family Mn-dependent transcriptional regulator
MMKHLSGQGLVDYLPRQGAALTDRGRATAMGVLRKHRLLELFLVEVMGLDWAEVHLEAEALEHALSDRLVDRIDGMLGHPERDPHGSPIPTGQGELPRLRTRSLSECEPGVYRFIRVGRETPGFLRWLKDAGLLPGTLIRLEAVETEADVVRIRVNEEGDTRRIGMQAAAKLLVAQENAV